MRSFRTLLVTRSTRSNANSSSTHSSVIVGAEHGLPVFLEFRSGVCATRFREYEDLGIGIPAPGEACPCWPLTGRNQTPDRISGILARPGGLAASSGSNFSTPPNYGLRRSGPVVRGGNVIVVNFSARLQICSHFLQYLLALLLGQRLDHANDGIELVVA